MARALAFISTDIGSPLSVRQQLDDLLLSEKITKLTLIDTPAGIGASLLAEREIDHTLIAPKEITTRKSISLIRDADFVLGFWDGRSLSELVFQARLLRKPLKIVPVQSTIVVNKDRGDQYDFYIGRGTPWGNPYVVGGKDGQHSREEAIDLYRQYFKEKILSDPQKLKGLLSMRGYKLACHCKPLACHGDVIASYLNTCEDPGLFDQSQDVSNLKTG